MTKTYFAQFIVIREVQVEADDDLQAERAAYQKLDSRDQGSAIALCVFDEDSNEGGGALASEDLHANWRYAKSRFSAIDPDWVNGGAE